MQALKHKSKFLSLISRQPKFSYSQRLPLQRQQAPFLSKRAFATSFQQTEQTNVDVDAPLRSVGDVIRPKKLNIEYMCGGALPLDKAGTVALPPLPERELVRKFLQEKQVSDDILVGHFTEMLNDFFKGLAS